MAKTKLILIFLFVLLFLFPNSVVNAQSTVLGPGDVAVIGYNSNTPTGTPQQIAIVLLIDVNPGTNIGITDFGWDNSSNAFKSYSNEGIIDWTADKYYPQGSIIIVTRGDSEEFELRTSTSDQIFLFQGNAYNNPSLLFGVNINANWTGSSTSATTSALPVILSTANANLVNPYRNSVLDLSENQFNSSSEALSYIIDSANWIGDDVTTQILPSGSINIGPTAIQLNKFQPSNGSLHKNLFVFTSIFLLAVFSILFLRKFHKNESDI